MAFWAEDADAGGLGDGVSAGDAVVDGGWGLVGWSGGGGGGVALMDDGCEGAGQHDGEGGEVEACFHVWVVVECCCLGRRCCDVSICAR